MNKIAKLIPVDGITAKDGDSIILNVKGKDYIVAALPDGKLIGYLAKTLSAASKFTTAAELTSLIEDKTTATLHKNGRTWTVSVQIKDAYNSVFVVGGGNKAIF